MLDHTSITFWLFYQVYMLASGMNIWIANLLRLEQTRSVSARDSVIYGCPFTRKEQHVATPPPETPRSNTIPIGHTLIMFARHPHGHIAVSFGGDCGDFGLAAIIIPSSSSSCLSPKNTPSLHKNTHVSHRSQELQSKLVIYLVQRIQDHHTSPCHHHRSPMHCHSHWPPQLRRQWVPSWPACPSGFAAGP